MPFRMSSCIQAVVVGDKLCVGGGFCKKGETMKATVMVYLLHHDSWETLPAYQTKYFGMAVLKNQLVLIGGRNTSAGKTSNVLGVWDDQSRTWTHPFPEMPSPQESISITSYKNWLINAGGEDEKGFHSKNVELLSTLSGQWYESSPLPNACSQMSSAISGNMWYLSRGRSSGWIGNKHVYSVCV